MEALGQLTGGVAHDFNNIMMIVSGYAQSLQGGLTDSKNARALQAIQAAISRGENLTRQLLSFSRHQPLHPIVLHPSDAVEGIRDVLIGSTRETIRLSVNIPEHTWPIFVDKSEFALALVNIVINARDAISNGGEITISAENQQHSTFNGSNELTGDLVVLKITDTGCGIPANVIPKVFDPFFTTKEVYKGTGLGLSQVYGFAHRSGGTVLIDSELQHGTTVTIYLPKSREPLVQSHLSDRVEPRGKRSGTILVVEDNLDVRGVATSLLQQLGYDTLEVDSAPAALERLHDGAKVNLIFSDIVLPGAMDGLELAAELETRYPRIPILLTTGYARRLASEPRYLVLRKSYDIVQLDDAINQAIASNQRLGGELSRNLLGRL